MLLNKQKQEHKGADEDRSIGSADAIAGTKSQCRQTTWEADTLLAVDAQKRMQEWKDVLIYQENVFPVSPQ